MTQDNYRVINNEEVRAAVAKQLRHIARTIRAQEGQTLADHLRVKLASIRFEDARLGRYAQEGTVGELVPYVFWHTEQRVEVVSLRDQRRGSSNIISLADVGASGLESLLADGQDPIAAWTQIATRVRRPKREGLETPRADINQRIAQRYREGPVTLAYFEEIVAPFEIDVGFRVRGQMHGTVRYEGRLRTDGLVGRVIGVDVTTFTVTELNHEEREEVEPIRTTHTRPRIDSYTERKLAAFIGTSVVVLGFLGIAIGLPAALYTNSVTVWRTHRQLDRGREMNDFDYYLAQAEGTNPSNKEAVYIAIADDAAHQGHFRRARDYYTRALGEEDTFYGRYGLLTIDIAQGVTCRRGRGGSNIVDINKGCGPARSRHEHYETFTCTWKDDSLREDAYRRADALLHEVRSDHWGDTWEQTLIDTRALCDDTTPLEEVTSPTFYRILWYGDPIIPNPVVDWVNTTRYFRFSKE